MSTTLAEVMALAREAGDIERRACIGKAQGFDVRDAYRALESTVAGILDALEAARADAGRYRQLRDRCVVHLLNDEVELRACIRAKTVTGIDATIDSAIHKGKA